jgi:MoxR-like ATPase
VDSAPGAVGRALAAQVATVVLDADQAVRMTVAAVLAGGHVLIEDVPGVGKTSLAKAMAASIGGTVGRIQGTPDLLPADITGFSVYNAGSGEWTFRPGPVFHNVVLVDEVNRATPRAQSALLEAMAEGQVTVDGVVRPLPSFFCVLATQNPLSDAGTFPLSAGQRDRFAVVVSLGLPAREAERAVVLGQGGASALPHLQPLASPDQLVALRAELETMHAAVPVVDYVLDVVDAVRRHPEVISGVSPRGSQLLFRVARALAALEGRGYVVPEDVKAAAPAVLSHRLDVRGGPGVVAGRRVVDEVLARVPAPVP